MNIREEILSRTNKGLEVFYSYMPINFVPKRNFRNPLYDDGRVSCNIYLDNKLGCYRMKDSGNDTYSGDCFWSAATMLGLDARKDLMNVLETIIRDPQLNISLEERKEYGNQRPVLTRPSRQPILPPPDFNTSMINEKWFTHIEQPLGEEERNYRRRHGIDTRTLQRFHVKSLACYESVSSRDKPFSLVSTQEEPMFAYCLGRFVKVYYPNSKLRFFYGGKEVDDYVPGFEQLPCKDDMIFITGGEKDVLSLLAHGFNAICFNSETAQIPENIIEGLLFRF